MRPVPSVTRPLLDLLCSALTLLLAPSWVATASAQISPREMGGVGITVYADSDFRGRNATYRDAVYDLQTTGMNDRISSLEVAPGETWEVCEHSNFRGRCQVFSGREPELRRRGWSDIISSMRPVRGGGGRPPIYPPVDPYPPSTGYGLELYERTGYQGDRRIIQGPVASLRALGFDNRAESLRLGRGETWEVCEDVNFRGCTVVNTDWPTLDRLDLRRRISSVRPWRQGGGGIQPPPIHQGRLVLYDRDRYRNQLLVIDTASAYLGAAGARAESVQVSGGVWEICERPQFQGRCTTISQSVPDLDRIGMRNGIGSARFRGPVPY